MGTARNVLLITVDQWSAAYAGYEGHPAVITPSLDMLSQTGVRYPNAYSECPVCVPARRTWMTGLHPCAHGALDNCGMPMPQGVPTLAQCFRDRGYQAHAVGKLHVNPQRDRIGFDEVLLDEEGRGGPDDYALWLADHGHAGERYHNAMGNNQYEWRPWHLEERLHPTAWATRQMARCIQRRDPTRPNFWYLSYSCPHPPIVPPRDYLDMYRDMPIPMPAVGAWVEQAPRIDEKERRRREGLMRAYFAQCTYIDHQLRLVIGTLREEGLLHDTVICFTADHGEQLGAHGEWAKGSFLEHSARVPFLLLGAMEDERFQPGGVDERLVGQEDLLPTLLDAAGLAPAEHATGCSVLSTEPRREVFGIFSTIERGGWRGPSRMLRSDEAKLIWYPQGNRVQLFDMQNDRDELHDLADDPASAACRADLERRLIERLPPDERSRWVSDGRLCACEPPPATGSMTAVIRGLYNQRGL
ncbi:MAG: sulfatase-like hydrolase/transferase [Planctomycetota bacterium]